MNLSDIMLTLLDYTTIFTNIEIGVELPSENDIRKVSYLEQDVETYFQQMNNSIDNATTFSIGIFGGRHERYFDVPIIAHVQKKMFGRIILATLGKKELSALSFIFTPLKVVYIDREGKNTEKQAALEEVVKMGLPYLGIFINSTTKLKKKGVKVGVSQLSARYDLPVIPIGINYIEDWINIGNRKIPKTVKIVFGQSIDALSAEKLEWEKDVLSVCDNNKIVMKEYAARILEKTYSFFDLPAPDYVKKILTYPRPKGTRLFT